MNTRNVAITIAILAATFTMLSQTTDADEVYGFVGNLVGQVSSRNTSIQPSKFEANEREGVIELQMPDTAGATYGRYRFTWKFHDDIRTLRPGQEYRFSIRGTKLGGESEKNGNTFYLKSSNGGSKLAEKEKYPNPGVAITLATPQFTSIVAYPKGKNNLTPGVIKVGAIRDRAYFTFLFSFSSHPYGSTSKKCEFEVVYVYDRTLIKR